MAEASIRYAVVTGGNRGIGFGICKKLASNGIKVVLTARDEKRGLEAVQKLKDSGFTDHIFFHQLDVVDQVSVVCLANFVRNKFGKLDILVNNAGISGINTTNIVGEDIMFVRDVAKGKEKKELVKWKESLTETPELAEECLNINYYGPKRLVAALEPLLKLSDSPTIVNVSSHKGMLQNIPNEEVRRVLGTGNHFTEETVDDVVREFLKDFKEGSSETKGWPACLSAYIISKAALNAYTRVIATRYPSFCINCVCPGAVKTDINLNTGVFTVEEGAEGIVRVVLLPNGGPSGCFFRREEGVAVLTSQHW